MSWGCQDCENLICYHGSRDRFGVPQEPDDYECKACEDITVEEFDKYFCDGKEWSGNRKGCSGFKMIDWSKYDE